MLTSNPSPTSIHERHSVTRNRIEFSCSSVKGTRIPPRSRGISIKRGLVRAVISRASLSFTQYPGCCVLGKPYLLR